jgi:hypothetical protein
MMGWSASARYLSGDVTDCLDQATGHPADRSEKLPNREAGKTEASRFGGLEAVFAFASGPAFQLVIDLMSNSAGFFNRLLH